MARTADMPLPNRSYAAAPNGVNDDGLVMNQAAAQARIDSGKLLLRVLIGALILLHGIAKLRSGPASIMGMLEQQGLPGWLAYGAYIGEVIAPLFLLAGFWTRAAAWVVAINMLFAVGLAHRGDIFKLGDQGGWAVELQALYLFGAIAVALIGGGRYSVGGAGGRWN